MLVLFIVVDSLRADAPSFAGGPLETATLDDLAAEGATFDNVFVSGAWTVPSMIAMLTGAPPHRVGPARWRHRYPSEWPNLLTAFADSGFEVGCIVPYPGKNLRHIPGGEVIANSQDSDEVVAKVRGRRGQDRFVLLHHWWTHLPYIKRNLDIEKWSIACDFQLMSLRREPKEFAATLARLYHAAVAYFSDELLPRVLDAALEGGDDVLLVLVGDHGESWGSALPPGRQVETIFDLHGRWITDETTRVPWLSWGRTQGGAINAGRRIGGVARGVDLGPTVAELAGIPWSWPSQFDVDQKHAGRSLAGSILGSADVPIVDALTVTSQNTIELRQFSDDGPTLWRSSGLRTADRWFRWDGISREGSVHLPSGEVTRADGTAASIFEHLESERLRAISTVSTNDDDSAPGEAMTEQMRALGYLD